jgi:hypothetical protein
LTRVGSVQLAVPMRILPGMHAAYLRPTTGRHPVGRA